MLIWESGLYQSALNNVECEGLQGKTIVITGATGMIGSCLIDSIMLWNRKQLKPCKVVAISRKKEIAQNRFSYCWKNDKFFSYIEQDVCNKIHELPEHVDYIIHAASNADPVSFATAPVNTLLSNVIGTNNLLEYGYYHGMKRFLYISSGEMYGQPSETMDDFVEDYCGTIDHENPRSCYPAGKRAAEVLCQCYISQYKIDSVVVRPCHIFGPTMTGTDSRAVSQFLQNAVKKENIVLKSAGLVERSHCYVIDAASAVFIVLIKGECGKAYNIADRQYQMTIRNFAQRTAKAGGCEVVFENPNDIEAKGYSTIARAVLDASRLEALGWRPCCSTISAIEETVAILREQGGA